MTIGIGILASEENELKAKPSHIVLIADTMGSFGEEYSHPRLHKIFSFPENDLYAVAANQIDSASGLLTMISNQIGQIPSDRRGIGDVWRAAGQAAFLFKMEKFNLSVLPAYGMPPATIAPHLSGAARESCSPLELLRDFLLRHRILKIDLILSVSNRNGQPKNFRLRDMVSAALFRKPCAQADSTPPVSF